VRTPIGIAAVGKAAQAVVLCDDGTCWMWAPVPAKTQAEQIELERRLMMQSCVPHTWVQFHTPIPGTISDEKYQEATT
jgi:hypothetical protein